MSEKQKTRKAKIRELNDNFHQHAVGNGSIMITAGVQALGEDKMLAVTSAVIAFDDFTPDNDPYGEHDFGSLDIAGKKIFWKIDYYDRSMEMGSPDPADETVTHRVLTIMLASEY